MRLRAHRGRSTRTLSVAYLSSRTGLARDDVDVRLVMAVVGADLEGEQRMLEREIGAEDQEGFAIVEIGDGGQLAGLAAQRIEQVATSPVRW